MALKKVIVVGGGPAGMIAAATAANEGAEVTIFEKMDRLGRKLLITGNGRCNLTNSAELDGFLAEFSDRGRFVKPVFCRFFNGELIKLFKELGVRTKIERGGRVFPNSDSSKEVLDALVG